MIWLVLLILLLAAIFGLGEVLELALWTLAFAAVIVALAFVVVWRKVRG